MSECEMCVSCRFFDGIGDQPYVDGACRRFPPVASPFFVAMAPSGKDDGERWEYPTVISGEWCGEYKRMMVKRMMVNRSVKEWVEVSDQRKHGVIYCNTTAGSIMVRVVGAGCFLVIQEANKDKAKAFPSGFDLEVPDLAQYWTQGDNPERWYERRPAGYLVNKAKA